MIARWILLALLPVVAGIALAQSRRLSAIIGMGLFSFMLAAAYLLMHAPDVAITEATIGAALVTAIYVLAIRRTGRLVVVADEVPGLIAREGDRVTGLEYEILEGFAKEIGLDLSIHFVPLRRVRWLVAHREADMGAGGMISRIDSEGTLMATPSHLETGVFTFSEEADVQQAPGIAPDYNGYFSELLSYGRSGTLSEAALSLDLARVIALGRAGASLQGLDRIKGEYGYSFLVARQRRDLQNNYTDYLNQLRASGQLAEMIGRHFS